jgi:hypothetical protein
MKSDLGQHSDGSRILVDPLDFCPLCHRTGTFVQLVVNYDRDHYPERIFQVLKCPAPSCNQVFVAMFVHVHPSWALKRCGPQNSAPRKFEAAIESASPDFVTIYNQALAAEESGLTEICGAGYRKALEFLMKDYLITEHPDNADSIKKSQLAACIGQYVSDGNLKTCAKRATWLGNDETHYVRRWVEKDLKDLKALIDLTVHWVQVEILTGKLEESMPDPEKAGA